MHWQGCRYDGGPRNPLKVGRNGARCVTNLFVGYGASCTIFYEEWYITWTNRSPWCARAKDELGDGEVIRNVWKRDRRAEFGHEVYRVQGIGEGRPYICDIFTRT